MLFQGTDRSLESRWREGEAGASSPPCLQLHNLAGSGYCQAGPCGPSLHLVTALLSSGTPSSHPSALRHRGLPVFTVSGSLTAPWLASQLFHPCVINPYIEALLFKFSTGFCFLVRCSLMHWSLSWSALIGGELLRTSMRTPCWGSFVGKPGVLGVAGCVLA